MHLFILTLGTRGDLELFRLLGRELHRRGHRVVLGSSPFYAEAIRAAGLEFVAIGDGTRGELLAVLHSLRGEADRTQRIWQYFQQWAYPQFMRDKDRIQALAEGADYFISNMKTVLRRRGEPIPGAFVTYDPPLDLDDLTAFGTGIPADRILDLVAMNRQLLDPKHQWGSQFHFTGFWRDDTPPAWEPSQELQAFLNAGPPPAVLTMGSMVMFDPAELAATFREALLLAKQRGIVVGGWSGLKPAEARPQPEPLRFFLGGKAVQPAAPADPLLCVDEVPYDWLFPQASCILHHGGCGTVGAVVRAGKPSILLPQIMPQQLFGTLLGQAGIAAGMFEAQGLKPADLAEALRRTVEDPQYALRGRAWQQHLALDGGLSEAADRIEAHGQRLAEASRPVPVPAPPPPSAPTSTLVPPPAVAGSTAVFPTADAIASYFAAPVTQAQTVIGWTNPLPAAPAAAPAPMSSPVPAAALRPAPPPPPSVPQANAAERPRLLFVLSNDFGEVSTAVFFTLYQPFESLFLLPPKQADIAHSIPVEARPYSSVGDVLAAVEQFKPDLVLLCSAYLYYPNNIFTMEELHQLVEGLRARRVRTLTSDPFLGVLARVDETTFNADPREQKMLAERFAEIHQILKHTIHLYWVDPTQWAATASAEGFSLAKLVDAPAYTPCREELLTEIGADRTRPRWLFVLAGEDYWMQALTNGPVFDDWLTDRLRDAAKLGKQPVLLAPYACTSAVMLRTPRVDNLILLNHCRHDQFLSLLLEAEYAFYWNIFSNSTLVRAVNRRPVFFFHAGHMARYSTPLFEQGVRCYFAGQEPSYLKVTAPLDAATVALQLPAQQETMDRMARCVLAPPEPAEIVRRVLGQKVLA